MKDYFEVILVPVVIFLVVASAIDAHELGEPAFGYYAQGAGNVALIYSLILYFNGRR